MLQWRCPLATYNAHSGGRSQDNGSPRLDAIRQGEYRSASKWHPPLCQRAAKRRTRLTVLRERVGHGRRECHIQCELARSRQDPVRSTRGITDMRLALSSSAIRIAFARPLPAAIYICAGGACFTFQSTWRIMPSNTSASCCDSESRRTMRLSLSSVVSIVRSCA